MASQLPMTLQDLQDRIHVLTSSDPTTPTSDDDQYKTRLTLINNAISRWERQDILWRELYASYTIATPISAGVTQYAIPTSTNFKMLASLIKCTLNGSDTYLDVINPSDVIARRNTTNFAYILGNPKDGYTLNLGWTPSATDSLNGASISFNYYKAADRLASPTDAPVMSDPDYIVYWAAAQELIFNGSNNLAQNYLAEADDSLRKMRIRNILLPAYASQQIPDVGLIRDNDTWGE